MKSCCLYSTGVLAILILIAGIALVLAQVFQNLLYNRIKREVVLENGTDAFDVWKDPPSPVYMQFYFFNLTNPEEVLSGDRPAVIELGPYTYREYRPMEEVNFMDNDTKVAAVNPKTYIFEPNMSRGSEDDIIRTVNIPIMTLMEKFQDSFLRGIIISLMISKNEGLFGTWKVRELLWGYEDPVLKDLHKFDPFLDPYFGLFYKMNSTGDGKYVFYTGKQNYQDFARVDLWRGESSLKWWTTDQCNMINGTNGAAFHPIIKKTEKLYMFSSDLCRSIYATFESELSVSGIPAYRFVPPSEVFANSTINPDNAGAPIIMSSPHFYQADQKFVDDIYGMRPQKEEHETAIDINPSVLIDEVSAKKLRSLLTHANVVINIPFIIIGLGILLGMVFIVLMCRRERSTPDEQQPLLTS
ncbi:Lysosome membrane protein 2 [Bagarius yarrelli]|uniref:Lysosome membrane protein 2 n=1 Tax=Bagarius yarrelli TaxID=175774 RepID=A0A556TUA7_BAGYA|nr:Lysosome membrane protein 2 [Bagarius yarrelli]